jgi:hypothetical protein
MKLDARILEILIIQLQNLSYHVFLNTDNQDIQTNNSFRVLV